MSTRIRLRRMGANKRPFYRVVVADQRSPRDGRFIENIGKYHPLEDPSLIEIDEERALHWLRVGAQPSDQVRNLMVKIGIWEKFAEERPAVADQVRVRAEKPDEPKTVEEGRREGPPRPRNGSPASRSAEPSPPSRARPLSPQPRRPIRRGRGARAEPPRLPGPPMPKAPPTRPRPTAEE